MNTNSKNRLLGTSLGFVAGYVDTLGFVALFGLFTAHVTGNFVLIGAALADPTQVSILLKFLAFPAFIAGVAIARLLIAAAESHHGPALPISLALEAILLCGFMLFGVMAAPIEHDVSTFAMTAGLLGAAAMGVHSAVSRLLLAQLAPTSMMTGNVTQVVIDAVDALRDVGDGTLAERCGKFLWPLLAFGSGAIVAAFAFRYFGFYALLAPIVLLGGVIALDWLDGGHAAAATT